MTLRVIQKSCPGVPILGLEFSYESLKLKCAILQIASDRRFLGAIRKGDSSSRGFAGSMLYAVGHARVALFWGPGRASFLWAL